MRRATAIAAFCAAYGRGYFSQHGLAAGVRRKTRPLRALLFALAAAVVLLAGCGGGGSQAPERPAGGEHESVAKTSPEAAKKPAPIQREVGTSVESWKGASDAGLILAEERGYFGDVGISPFVGVPINPRQTVRYVVDGTDDIGVASQAEVAIARARGAPIVAIGSLVPQPTAALIWMKNSGIAGIADLRGKTVAIPGVAYQEALLEAVLNQHGLSLKDVKLKSVGYKLVPALLKGKADAIFGGSWNVEGIELKSLGRHPVIRRVQRLGIPPYEEAVLIARTDEVKKQPGLIRRFMSALARGTTAALEHPAATVKILEAAPERNPELSPGMTAAEVKATLPLLSRTGAMDAGRVAGLVRWLHEEELIQKEVPVSQLLTSRFVGSS
ncbi:MAG TPA: ABC transporter substrate-binding protein [Solirubrobacterales bacterium]|nr:ABC transporter substrate-binding protein [Solirubrobacterales bacterium]